ncbi:MAG: hypothetical protein HY984_02320, partial [Candidatus Magasanikbacteria bacterium]|nr:hypothetical protein [Candidatus Magasanikbacteria bacterium]
VNVNSYTAWGGIVGKGDVSLGSYAMGLGSGNSKLRFNYNMASPWTNYVDSTTDVPLAQWAHVAVTYDGVNVRHYINGALDKTTPLSVSFSQGATGMAVGCDPPGTMEYFNGKIDEVRVYSIPLSSAQIAQDYNNRKPLYNTIVQQETLGTDTSWTATVTLNDAQTVNPNSTSLASNAIDPSNAAPDQGTPVSRSHAPLDSGHVLGWRFEDGIGATAFDDQTAANNNGSCTNCPTWSQEGAVGGAYQFDGTNDQVVNNALATPVSGAAVTLSFWAKPMASGHNGGNAWEYDIMVGKSDTGSSSRDLTVGITSANKLRVYAENPSGAYSSTDSTNALTIGQWVQVTATGSASNYCLYLNGTLDTCTTFSSDFYIQRLGVGNSNVTTWTTFYNGFVDEVNLYNRTFSAAEVKTLYNSSAYVYDNYDLGVSPVGLSDGDNETVYPSIDWRNNGTSAAVLNMSFNKNVTSTTTDAVLDYSSYSNDGTLGGGNSSYVPTWTNASTCGNNTGGCYDFDGTNDRIQVLDHSSLNPGTSDFSISFWLKMTAGGDHAILSKRAVCNNASYWDIRTLPSYSIPLAVEFNQDGSGTNYFYVSTDATDLNNGNWHFFSVVRQGTGATLYVNGAFDSSASASGITNISNTANLLMGYDPCVGSDSTLPFAGQMDEVQIYNRALSSAEIASLYNSAKPNYQNLSNTETAIGDLWSANMCFADASGNEGITLASNSVEILGFSTDVSDGGSSATTPTNVGSNVTFTGTYNAASGRQWYLAICKTNAVTAGSDAAPTCDGGNWAISAATNDGAQASVNYTALVGDAESNAWYAFGCDKVASVATCSPVSQGSTNPSPFNVNHAPTFGTLLVGSATGGTGSIVPGSTVYFHLNANGGANGIDDNDADTTQDTVRAYICDSNTTGMSTPGTCTGGTLICSQSTPFDPNSTAFECSSASIAPIPTPHGSVNFKVFVFDSHNFAGTGTTQQSYSVADVAPVVQSYTTNTITPQAGISATTSFTVTVTDNNGGNDVTAVNGLIYNSNTVTLASGDCTANELNCIKTASCLFGTPSGINVTATCGGGSPAPNVLTAWYNINPSTPGVWKAHANPTDQLGTVTNGTDSNAFTVNTLSAVSVSEASIDYSTVAVGGTSDPKTTTLLNAGNIIIDVLIHGDNMTSGGNTIARAQQHWATSGAFTWGTADHALAASDPTPPANADAGCANRSIAVTADHNTMTSSPIYWKLQIPSPTPSGTYNGTNYFLSTANDCTGTD